MENPIKLAALIIETRTMINLAQVIFEHISRLPKGTDLFIFTSYKNEYLTKFFPNATFQMIPDVDVKEYNKIMTFPAFWEDFLEYDRVLVFQSDSMLLRTGIEEFFDYDYVGAPWKFEPYRANGGLSLRNPKIMYDIAIRYPWNGQINEDVWFCMHMNEFSVGRLAPVEVCGNFSCETIFKLGTLGFHSINSWLTAEECRQIREQYIPFEEKFSTDLKQKQ